MTALYLPTAQAAATNTFLNSSVTRLRDFIDRLPCRVSGLLKDRSIDTHLTNTLFLASDAVLQC